MERKFTSLSPYNFVANSPISSIDPDGRDIIILSYGGARRGHTYGHQAVLISNDNGTWTFYSKDKDNSFTDENRDVVNDNFTIKTFKDIEEFANSEYNTLKVDYDDGKGFEFSEKDSDGNIIQRFREGYLIETTPEQDKLMRDAAEEETRKDFSTFNSNCTHCPKSALDAGGLNNGEYTEGDFFKNYFPDAKQKEIENSNEGTDVDDKLIPTDYVPVDKKN